MKKSNIYKGIVLVVMAVVVTGCGLPTAVVKTAMTTNISKCDNIIIGTTTKDEVEKILKDKPVGVKRAGENTISTYRSGYFNAKVTYTKDNLVSDYECSKE